MIILYGSPGSGKGTQANLLAGRLGLIHFDTGRFLESLWYDPRRQKEKLVQREKRLFAEGKLNTPSFVAGEVIKGVKTIARAGLGMAFSGSPRTVYEAEKEMPIFEHLYGRKNIFVFELNLHSEGSIKRNSARLMCSVCGYGLLTAYYPSKKPKHCPVCGGPFYRRTLDKPGVIKVRLKEYLNRTYPIFGILKARGYEIHKIDARPAPYKVLQKILRNLKLKI